MILQFYSGNNLTVTIIKKLYPNKKYRKNTQNKECNISLINNERRKEQKNLSDIRNKNLPLRK